MSVSKKLKLFPSDFVLAPEIFYEHYSYMDVPTQLCLSLAQLRAYAPLPCQVTLSDIQREDAAPLSASLLLPL